MLYSQIAIAAAEVGGTHHMTEISYPMNIYRVRRFTKISPLYDVVKKKD